MDEKYQNHGKYLSLPVITTTSKRGQSLYWQVFVGLVSSDTPNDFATGKVPSDLLILSSPIQPIYLNGSRMDQKLKGYKLTATWRDGGEPILKAATFITKGKNENKDNRTNVWTQTLKEALSDYNKRNKTNEHQDLLAPMLASGEAIPESVLTEEVTKIWDKHEGNIRTQAKFDGHRLLVKFDRNSEPHIYPYSRSRDPAFVSDELMADLRELYKTIFTIAKNADDIVYTDGEYYLHGMSLQAISSAVRLESQSEAKTKLEYHIFDIVVTTPDGIISNDRAEDRLWWVHTFKGANRTNLIKFVESRKPRDIASMIADYNDKRSNGYEGLIIRVLGKKYESGRSSSLIKMKGLFREEFRITGVSEGTGKHAGLAVFKCCLTEQSIERARNYMNDREIPVTEFNIAHPRDVSFNVTPKATEDERRKMFEEGASYIGKLYTVEFQDWSKDFKPLRPIGISLY